jgi:hypothetical protein
MASIRPKLRKSCPHRAPNRKIPQHPRHRRP